MRKLLLGMVGATALALGSAAGAVVTVDSSTMTIDGPTTVADVTTIGFTGLRPGIHVNLSGLYAPFDGVYYVTTAVHTLSAEGKGFTTKCSLRRPGMLDPSAYPGG